MDYINLGILAHVDAGKTTIVEQLLYRSGVLRAPGSVEKGNTQTDWLSVERERGISVRSSSVSLDHNGIRINLIDTPGHFDFTGETERALGVLDAAVLVVSAAEGIQSQTEIFWNALKTLRIPVLLFVNKIDRMGCDPAAVLDALKSEFSEAIFPLNAAVAPGSRECGARPSVFTDDDILALCERDAQLAGQYLSGDGGGMNGGEGADEGDGGANGGADADEGDGGANGGDQVVSRGQLTAALARLSKRAAAYPLLFGSAALGLGMSELLDAVTEYLPAANAAPDGDLLGIIYKIEHDRAMGKIAHVRLFTGTLRNRDTVWLERAGGAAGTGSGALPNGAARAGGGALPGAPTAGIEEKVTQIKRITGARREDTGVLCGGDIAAIYGLAGARTGDILRTPGSVGGVGGVGGMGNADGVGSVGSVGGVGGVSGTGGVGNVGGAGSVGGVGGAGSVGGMGGVSGTGGVGNVGGMSTSTTDRAYEARLRLRERTQIAVPLFSVQVFAEAGFENQLLHAVSELSDEDPLLEYEWEPDARELVIRVMGKIQLEILEYLFRERYGMSVRFSAPTVIYKETPAGTGVGLESYTMPKPCWAVVQLAVEPLPRGSGYRYESVIKEGELPYRYQNHVALTVPQALKQGLLNWETTDLKVTLIGGQHHHVHTHPMDFFLATPIAVMKALQDAGTLLLEPLLRVRLAASEEYSGKLIGDIVGMRGTFDSPVTRGGSVTIEAILPVAGSMDYSVRFSSLTSGKGTMKTAFAGYRVCPVELGAVAKRRGVNPLDRMRWILYKRNALS